MNAIDTIINAGLCGILAAVYHAILIAPGKILSKPRQWLEALVEWIANCSNYGRAYGIAVFITKSLIDCSWCMAGQLGLLHYLWTGGRDPFDMALYVGAAILSGEITFKYLTSGKTKADSRP